MSVDKRLTAEEKKKIKPVVQAGTKNFLGKQEMVTVPKKWLSSSDHVVAELAYITPREQKILIDKNLYGSLKGKPNVGPGGIMSLQGGDSGGLGGDSSSDGEGDGPSERDKQMGLQGKTGKEDKSLSSGGSGIDRSKVSQFSEYGKNLMAKNLQSLAPNPIERGLEFYNKYGLIPNAARVVDKIFSGIFDGPTTGYATDYQGTTGPSQVNEYDDNRGGDGGRNLYAATNQYTAPTPVEEEGITTVVNDPNFIQRFMVKEPYRQAKGLDFLAQNQGIANMINNLYT
jgi:hypothetical protein